MALSIRPVQVWLLSRSGLSFVSPHAVCIPTCERFHRGGTPAGLGWVHRLASLICPHGRNHMLRSILSAVALAGLIAVAHPAFADPLAATPADHAQPAAAA